EGRLQLETVSAILTGGSNGPAVVKGFPEQSLLIEKIHSGEMPPTAKDRLSSQQVAVLERWIKSGIPAQESTSLSTSSLFTNEERQHWAFRPLIEPRVPQVAGLNEAMTAIDRFLLSRLEARGLSFSVPTDRRTWLRRLTFDLTGLPPTIKELSQFESDQRP